MKKIRRIFIGLGIALVAVCFGALVLFNWSVTGWKALSVPTGSMRPNIPPSSLVLMKSVPLTSLKVGDVITYINPQNMKSTVSHRIVKTYKIDGKIPAFITKGDANRTADQPVVGGLVKGKVVWHAPYIGGILAWSRTWVGIAFVLYLPALIVIIDEMRRLIAYYKKMVPYKAQLILEREKAEAEPMSKLGLATLLSLLLVGGSALFAYPVHALLRSNTVALVNNHLTVAKKTPPTCGTSTSGNSTNTSTTITTTGTGSGTNNVNVSSSTNQTATTGNATSSGNTNGGSATSGNASNCSTTTITINITNH